MRTLALGSAAVVLVLGVAVAAQTPTLQRVDGPVTLRDALARALEQSPALRAFDWGRRSTEARTLQAGRRPNPTITTMVEDIGGSRNEVNQSQTTIQLGQIVELGGKRAARQQVASVNHDLAVWDYEAARLDVLVQVTSSFVGVLAAQEAVRHASTALDLAGQVRRAVDDRVEAGVVSPIEAARAEVLVAFAQLDADRTRRALDARRQQLALLWGLDHARLAEAVGDLREVPPIPTLEALDARLPRVPEVARWASEVEHRQAALALARASRVPDITVAAGYRRFTAEGRNAFVVGATIPIPWFDRNRDGIRAAEADVERSRAMADAAILGLRSRLADAYRDLVSANDALTILQTSIVPGAQAVFDAVREGYQLGRFGLLDVLDAQKTLTDANRQQLDALIRFHHATAQVERLVGGSLSGVTDAPASGK
ncbi:MAG: TolC family protein [Acidobacteria bacterium]|nr:TolC family protein [Acidobacteriota bacterium]